MLTERQRPFWASILLFLGVYLPTSSGGEITKGWTRLALAVVSFLLLALMISRRGTAKKDLLWIGVFIPLLLLLLTPFSLLPDPVYGILAAFATFSLLIGARLDNIRSTRLIERTFLLANVANIILGFGIVFQFDPIQSFLINNYSSAYPELVASMMELGKPVLTYSTHSLAALVHYLFFWVNLCAYKQTGKKTHLYFSLIYAVFLLSMLSVSGVLFFFIALTQLVRTFARGRSFNVVLRTCLLALTLLGATVFLASQGHFADGIATEVRSILLSQGNGFLGRYSSEGQLLPVLDYLSAHPFRPTGLMTSEDMVLIDSGPLDYYIRGSVVLLLLMYGGFFIFLKRNLHDPRKAYFLFGVVLCFETGFSALTSFRFISLLPIMIIYLNALPATKPERVPSFQLATVNA